jgi:hypothetical protein
MDKDQAPDEPVTRPGSFADTGPGEGGGWRTGCGALLVTAALVVLGLLLMAAGFAPEDERGSDIFRAVAR